MMGLTADGFSLQKAVGFRTTDFLETMPLIERADRVPVQILQPYRQPHTIRQRKTVRKNGRTYSPALMLWEQVKLSEAQVIRLPLKRQRSKSLLRTPYLEERLLAIMALM